MAGPESKLVLIEWRKNGEGKRYISCAFGGSYMKCTDGEMEEQKKKTAKQPEAEYPGRKRYSTETRSQKELTHTNTRTHSVWHFPWR